METMTFDIIGMACGGCANTIRQALLALNGVVEADVSHVKAQAAISYDSTVVTVEQMKYAITATGYQISG